MNRLFIRMKDGKPVDHPILESNLIEAYPHIDVDNLPNEFIEFIRTSPPKMMFFDRNLRNEYIFEGNCIKEIWHKDTVPEEEQVKIIQERRNVFSARFPERTSWTFDYETGFFQAPKKIPQKYKDFIRGLLTSGDAKISESFQKSMRENFDNWDESTQSWLFELEVKNVEPIQKFVDDNDDIRLISKTIRDEKEFWLIAH